MVTYLEQDIMECEVKLTLGNITKIKVSGGNVFPAELFQILQDAAGKVLHSTCQQIRKTQQGHRTGKCVFIKISMNFNAK